MLSPEFPEKESVKFPRIPHKSKSMPSNPRSTSITDLITAKSWMYCTPTSQYGFKSQAKRQIASLTKIMTGLCALEICEKYNMNIKTTYFKVTGWAAVTIGTTADLQQNAWISVEDLMYGMMLPSGNDAASVLAQNLGAVLYFDKVGNKSLIQQIRSIDLTEDHQSIKFYQQQFVSYMNLKCKNLKMFKTRFANPHGLDHINNYSCCEDVYLMAKEAMKNETMRKVVKTVSYKGTFKYFRQGKVVTRSAIWTNTNKLLQNDDIYGIKTGITNKAGGCLATLFNIDVNTEGYIIVLGCNSTQARFRDTLKIMNWACEESMSSTGG